MYFQSIGRNQRPKGFHVKQWFQFVFILAVLIWLLYQIKHSNDSKGERTVEAKFSKGTSIAVLGRKGGLELSNKDAILEPGGKPKDRGGGDDKLYENADEEERVKLHKQKEYKHGNVDTDARERKMDPERPYNMSRNSQNIEIEMRDKDNAVFSEDNFQEGLENSKSIISELDGFEDEKDQKRQNNSDERGHKDLERHSKELQRDENTMIDTLKQGKDEDTSSSKEHSEDKGLLSSERINQNEVASGLHGFHDENGVPQGGNDAVEFTLAKSRDGQANYILQQENTTKSNTSSK